MDEHSSNQDGKNLRKLFLKKIILFSALFLLVLGAATPLVYSKASNSPSFCATCHVIKPYYRSWSEGPLLAAKHAAIGIKCVGCHQQSLPEKLKEGTGYITGNYENPLKERDFSREKCLQCHEKDWGKVVQATNFEMSNPHESHLGEIDCSLCHNMHRESEVNCAQCHDFDWFKTLDKSWKVQSQ